LQDSVSATTPGRTVKVKIAREGQTRVLSLKTEKLSNKNDGEDNDNDEDTPKQETREGTTEWLGATFSNLTPRLVNKYELSAATVNGVVAVDVPSKSAAADAGLEEGDVIRAVNRSEIKSVAGLSKIKGSADPKKGLVVDVVRDGHSFYLSYKSLQ
jgi:serine protease Do